MTTPGLGEDGRPARSSSRKRTGSADGDSSRSESGGSSRRRIEFTADVSDVSLTPHVRDSSQGRPSDAALEADRRQTEDARNLPVRGANDVRLVSEVDGIG